MSPPTPAEVVARLVGLAEDLARVAADVVTLVHAPQPSPVVIQPVPSGEERAAWKVSEFAESLGLHQDTVRRLLRSGEIRGFKVKGQWRISETERTRWVAEMEQRTADGLSLLGP